MPRGSQVPAVRSAVLKLYCPRCHLVSNTGMVVLLFIIYLIEIDVGIVGGVKLYSV